MDGDNKSDWLRISANFRWRRYGLVANYSWAILRVRCTGQESNNFTWSWLARNMTVFPVKDRLVQVECVLISRSSQTLPLVLDLVIKVTATNSLWSDAKEQTMYRSVEVPKWVEQASAIKNLALSVLPIIATSKPKACSVYCWHSHIYILVYRCACSSDRTCSIFFTNIFPCTGW